MLLTDEIKTELKQLLEQGSPDLSSSLREKVQETSDFSDFMFLSKLRKKAKVLLGFEDPVRLALIGASTLYPFHELLEQALFGLGTNLEVFVGEFDNYVQESLELDSNLYKFNPDLVIIWPDIDKECNLLKLSDSTGEVSYQIDQVVNNIMGMCERVHSHSGAEVFLMNFSLPATFDPGSFRQKSAGSEWNFKKRINFELGLKSPKYIHIIDLEFFVYRYGASQAYDKKLWLETKIPYAMDFLTFLGKETAREVSKLKTPIKKVLVLDLDNTLWGGVIGDDGVEGIELGGASSRGQAFQAFQQSIIKLKDRGVLLAIASKNEYLVALEAISTHPEMTLDVQDFVAMKINWGPKSESLRQIALELNLGLDSFVFIDDNPAEIELVNQTLPQVETLLLPTDPSQYVDLLKDIRHFEPQVISSEDAMRTGMYFQESQRKELLGEVTNMSSYLESLDMSAKLSDFNSIDMPRIVQLINKSNQFNLTTIRRTEADLQNIVASQDYQGLTVCLKDKFGSLGLISVLVLRPQVEEGILEIDTWLMSCRVLKRQVENIVLGSIIELARSKKISRICGRYLPTKKNAIVKAHYENLGFTITEESNDGSKEYHLDVESYKPIVTKIKLERENGQRPDIKTATAGIY